MEILLQPMMTMTMMMMMAMMTTDLHIYNLDTVPPVHVLSNHMDTNKLTTANGGTFYVYVEFSQSQ